MSDWIIVALTVVHLVCCVGTYLVFRWDTKKTFKKWTVGDRRFAFSLSWLGLLALMPVVLIVALNDFTDEDTPAGW